MPVGIGLMIVMAVLRLLRVGKLARRCCWRRSRWCGAWSACCSCWPARCCAALGKLNLLIFFVGVVGD